MKYFAPNFLGLFAYLAPDAAPASDQVSVSNVEIDPPTVRLRGGARQLFDASVFGSGGPSQEVLWRASAGSIDRGGLFTAPAASAIEQAITITAISVLDGEKIGTAVATIEARKVDRTAHTVNVTVLACDQQGNAMAGAVITAKLDREDIDQDSGFMAPEEIIADSNSDGIAILKLWPNVRGSKGSKYQFKIRNPDTTKLQRYTATVPDRDCILHQIAD